MELEYFQNLEARNSLNFISFFKVPPDEVYKLMLHLIKPKTSKKVVCSMAKMGLQMVI
jgi:hypothetical protein